MSKYWDGTLVPRSAVSIDDAERIDKAISKIPEPTCYVDYCKTYTIPPNGDVQEIETDYSKINR